MTQIVKVSKEGNNVLTTTDPDELNFSSDYNTLKYYSSGSAIGTINGADGEATVSHNLGYVPFFTAYVDKFSPPNTWSMCPQTFKDVFDHAYLNAYADTANIYLKWEVSSAIVNVTFYYKIFKNNTGL